MCAANLADIREPYVHSNIANYYNSGDWGHETDKNNNKIGLGKELEEAASRLREAAKILRTREVVIYDACGVNDYNGLNRLLIGNKEGEKTLQQAALRVLNDRAFINSLVPKIGVDKIGGIVGGIFKDDLAKDLMTQIESRIGLEKIISITDLAKIIREELAKMLTNPKSKYFGEVIISSKGAQNRIKVNDLANYLIGNANVALGTGINKAGKAIMYKLESKSGEIYKLIRDQIQRLSLSNLKNIDFASFDKAFREAFDRLQKEQIINLSSSPDCKFNEDLSNLINRIYKLYISNDSPLEKSGALGQLGEQGLKFSAEDIFVPSSKDPSVTIKIEVDVTGQDNETQTANKIFEKMGKSKDKVANYKFSSIASNSSAQGKTDDIIYIKEIKNGVERVKTFFRVQSKNKFLEEANSMAENNTFTTPIRMTEEESYLKLVGSLEGKYISSTAAASMSYFLANYVWFHAQGARQRSWKGGLEGSIAMISKILSIGIGAFIGTEIGEKVGIGKKGKVLQSIANKSVIFYWLGNRVLYPVSNVLEEAADIIERNKEEATNKIFNIKYIVNTESARYAYGTAQSFLKAKQKAVGEFIPSQGYSDSNLLNIGRRQGGTIIGSIKTQSDDIDLEGHINFYFNIAKILQTAFSLGG